MKNEFVVDAEGAERWYRDDKLPREDGPAVEYAEGTKFWYQNGNLHREDGPAIEFANGSMQWYYKHIFAGSGDKPDPTLWTRLTSTKADGGPLLNGCVVDTDRNKHWFKDGKRHREDGPAVEYVDGTTEWYFNGQLLGYDTGGFWLLWDLLTEEQRGSSTLLRYLPR